MRACQVLPVLALLALLGPVAAATPAPGSGAAQRAAAIVELLGTGRAPGAGKPSPIALDLTRRRVEAFHRYRALPEAERLPLAPLFAVPPTAGCVTAVDNPKIRCCYRTLAEQAKAGRVCEQAAEAWRGEVDGLGFAPPRTGSPEHPEEGILLQLGDTRSLGAAGYTSPIDYDPSTPQADCLTYIVLDESEPDGEELTHTIRHEFNHACQLAMDCQETLASLEATATWVNPALKDGVDAYFEAAIPYFQRQPDRSLGWSPRDELYPYGAALFMQYVQEWLGEGDPAAVVDLWRGTVQEGDWNEPDLLDVLSERAVERGLSLDELLLRFGEWRFFVGEHDDGRHFARGGDWLGAEVPVEGRLPLTPDGSRQLQSVTLQPLGYRYTELTLSGEAADWEGSEVVLSLGASTSSRGLLELWLLDNGQLSERFGTRQEDGSVAPALAVDGERLVAAERRLLVLVNAPSEVDWDGDWPEQTLRLVADVLVAPAVEAVTPPTVVIGRGTPVTVRGRHLGADTTLVVEGEGVSLGETSSPEPGVLRTTVTVSPGAQPGPRTLRLVNRLDERQRETALPGGLTLVLPTPPGLLRLQPDSALPGATLVSRLDGSQLPTEPQLAFDCQGLTVERSRVIDAATVYLDLAVDADAAPGPCALTVADRWGQQATLAAAFTIVGSTGGEDAGPGVDSGLDRDTASGCQLGAGAGSFGPGGLLLLGAALLLGPARRRFPTAQSGKAQARDRSQPQGT